MDYQKIDELLLKIKSAYESIGAETELVVEEPASIAEVESIENIIERKLPLQIRDFFLQYSKKCEFSAWLPDGFELPSELDEIFSANFLISLEEFADAEKARNGWVENCFTNEYRHIFSYRTLTNWKRKLYWYNKHRLSHPQVNPSVVYLSHDDGEGHGYILGKDFNTYLEQLLLVGACGNEDWQMLPFCLDAQSGIVSDCENAKEYRKLIGLQI